jgi:hypothetical protein
MSDTSSQGAGTRAAGQWAVRLQGQEWELTELAQHLTGSIDISKTADRWELTADQFQRITSAESIRTVAREIVGLINGVARVRLEDPEPISVVSVLRYRTEATFDAWAFPDAARMRARLFSPTVLIDGVPSSTPSSWEPDLALAEDDVKARAVLAFLGIPPTWHSLYAALDVVLKDRRTRGRAGVKDWGGVSLHRLKQFTRTANSWRAIGVLARHGPEYQPPKEPMTFEDAKELVRHIVECWLDQLQQQRTPRPHSGV